MFAVANHVGTERRMKRLEGTLSHLRASACTGAAELITRDHAGAPPRAREIDASAPAPAEFKLSAGELAQFNRVPPPPPPPPLRARVSPSPTHTLIQN